MIELMLALTPSMHLLEITKTKLMSMHHDYWDDCWASTRAQFIQSAIFQAHMKFININKSDSTLLEKFWMYADSKNFLFFSFKHLTLIVYERIYINILAHFWEDLFLIWKFLKIPFSSSKVFSDPTVIKFTAF